MITRSLFTLICLIFSFSVSAAELVKAADGSGTPGYKDTPKQPWSPYLVHDPDRPVPRKVNPGPATKPAVAPEDAVVLFDGSSLSQWSDTTWKLENGTLVADGNKSPSTKQQFGSFQLHLEFKPPADFDGPWHNQGNNGVMLHGLYEIQIFDSYSEPLYPDGQCASVYGQTPPMVNACRKPGEWQTYDIHFQAPVFEGKELKSPANVTVVHNGVLVHHHQVVHGGTGHRILPNYKHGISQGPISLAGHGCPVAFRNIWIREL